MVGLGALAQLLLELAPTHLGDALLGEDVNVGAGTIAWIEAGHPVVAGEDPGH